jgi:hypothetical protein
MPGAVLILRIESAASVPIASHEGDFERLVHILYGYDFARRRHVDDFAHDLFEWLAIGAAVLVHFFRFAPTAIE